MMAMVAQHPQGTRASISDTQADCEKAPRKLDTAPAMKQ